MSTKLDEHYDAAMARGGLKDFIAARLGDLPPDDMEKVFDAMGDWAGRVGRFHRERAALIAEQHHQQRIADLIRDTNYRG